MVNGQDLTVLLGTFGDACEYVEVSYDYRNQMTQWQACSADCETSQVHRYAYDALSRRVRITTDVGAEHEHETVRLFGGDAGWQLLEEREGQDGLGVFVGASGTTLATYLYSGRYIDDIASMRRNSEQIVSMLREAEQSDPWFKIRLRHGVGLTDCAKEAWRELAQISG